MRVAGATRRARQKTHKSICPSARGNAWANSTLPMPDRRTIAEAEPKKIAHLNVMPGRDPDKDQKKSHTSP